MTATVYVSAVGALIGIDLSALDDDDAAAVRAAWTDAVADLESEPAAVVSPVPGDRARMLMSLSQQVTLAAIGARRRDVWMLHAAGIATDDGDTVVFVGPSGRGKTTLSRALGAHYGYVSDETIGIERDGRVLAYRKPLSIIEDPAAPKAERAPSSVGLRDLPRAELRVRAIVLLDRDPAHDGPPVVETLDLGDAIEDLVAQTSFMVDRPDPLRFMAAVAAATGGIRSVTYREAVDLPAIVPDLVAGAFVEPVVEPRPDWPTTTRAHASGPRFSRAEVIDELVLPDPERVALLTTDDQGAGTVHVLAGVGPAVWAAADRATLGDLTAAVVAAHGEPPEGDAETAVAGVVDELVEKRLLTRDDGKAPALA